MVWKYSQRRWSCECPKSPVQSLPCSWWGFDLTKWFGIKQLCNAGSFWQIVQSFVVLACAEHAGLTPHVGNSSGLPKPFPEDSHIRPVRCMFVQVVDQLFSLEVIPFSFLFPSRVTQGWQGVYCSLKAKPAVGVAAKTQPPRDSDLNLACWLLSLDSLAPLSLGKKKIYLVTFKSRIVMKLGWPDVSF